MKKLMLLLAILALSPLSLAQTRLPIVILTSEPVSAPPSLVFVDAEGTSHEVPTSGIAPGVNTGRLVGIGTSSPGGKLEVETSTTAAVATLVLDQNDVDQPFITFAGEEGVSDEKNLFSGDESDLVYAGAVLVAVDAGSGATPYWMKLYQVV